MESVSFEMVVPPRDCQAFFLRRSFRNKWLWLYVVILIPACLWFGIEKFSFWTLIEKYWFFLILLFVPPVSWIFGEAAQMYSKVKKEAGQFEVVLDQESFSIKSIDMQMRVNWKADMSIKEDDKVIAVWSNKRAYHLIIYKNGVSEKDVARARDFLCSVPVGKILLKGEAV